MNPNKKVLLTMAAFMLVLMIIACSCGSLGTATPTGSVATAVPVNDAATSIPSNGAAATEAIPGLAGKWLDPQTHFVHTIVWQNDSYLVSSVVGPDGSDHIISGQVYRIGSVSWNYHSGTEGNGPDIYFTTVSVSGDNLDTTWSSTDGSSGTRTLVRVQGNP